MSLLLELDCIYCSIFSEFISPKNQRKTWNKKTESVFAPKPDRPKEEKPSLFIAKTEEPKLDTPSGFNLGTKTDVKPKPSLVAKETPKATETKQEEKPKELEKKG